MSEYPDNWVVLEILTQDHKPIYKVLAGWSGGYLGSDCWKLNSGIVEVRELDNSWVFIGHSGNQYVCDKDQYKLRMNNAGIYEDLLAAYPNTIRMMPEDTDWKKVSALMLAEDKANNLDFKKLWNDKLNQLLSSPPASEPVFTTPQGNHAWAVRERLTK